MNGTTQIILGGQLGTRFGREWNLALNNPCPAEAIRAIDVNLGGKLRAYMGDREAKRFYRVAIGHRKNELDLKELGNRSGGQTIYILPVVKGRNSGFGKILAGLALIAVAVFAPFASGSIWPLVFGGLGASLVLGGISQLIAPTPNFNQNASDNKGSSIFQGNAVVVSQGNPVGLVYGRALVSPMPIMIAYNNADQFISSDQPVGSYGVSKGPGGIVQYPPDVNFERLPD